MIQLDLNNYSNKKPCYWDIEDQELKGSQKAKAIKFNQLQLIRKMVGDEYRIYPIKGYNKTTYTVNKTENGWKCNCQYYNRNKLRCSHILAVGLYIYERNNI